MDNRLVSVVWALRLCASTHAAKIGLDLIGPYHERLGLCRAPAEASAQLGRTPPVVTPSKPVLAVDVDHCAIGYWSALALNTCRETDLRQAKEACW
jgi:hypothetical protein